jgi:hypothetical protein
MAGTILVRECLRRASKLLGDISPQFQRHPEQELVDFLNDAALAIVKFLPSSASRVDAIKLKPGTRQSIETIAAIDCKPGDGSTPAAPVLGMTVLGGAMRNMGADGATPGRVIRITDRKILDAQDPDWHLAARAGTVVKSMMFDPLTPRYFYVTPPVHASTAVWIELPYNAQPVKVPNTGTPGSEAYLADGGSTVVIPISDEYIDDLTNYVVARANMKETEWADANKATYFAGLFLNSLNGKVTALTGTNPNLKRLPFAPEPVGAAS